MRLLRLSFFLAVVATTHLDHPVTGEVKSSIARHADAESSCNVVGLFILGPVAF